MAAPANLVTTLNSVGNREDLEDVIYRVAPEKTPFVSAIKKTKATARFHEWQTEALATPNPTNAQLEGDDATIDTPNLTARIGNFCQIFRKTYGVSRTQEVVDKAGRASELNRQKVLKGIELRRDIEARFIGNYGSNNESGATPRRSAGALGFIVTNVARGAGGASGGFSGGTVTAATNGTLRTFAETQVKAVMATAFNNGATPTMAFMGAVNKQEFSAFPGIAQIRVNVTGREQATIMAGAEVYVSDFGQLMLIPHPYGLTRDCLIVDPDYMAVATLDGFKSTPLAKTGDSDKFMLIHEATLVVNNELAHGVVADIQ